MRKAVLTREVSQPKLSMLQGKVLLPRGAKVELVILEAKEKSGVKGASLQLGLRSVTVEGNTYLVISQERKETAGLGTNRRTAQTVGGGAALGTLIGAAAGGGSGAVLGGLIGAAAGAAVQVLTQGKEVRIPAESVLRFRLDEPIPPRDPLTKTERRLVELWIGLRIFTLIWVALWSGLRPMTDREKAIPMWPPTAPYASWVERVVIAPWQRWDVHYYVDIVEKGYRNDNGTAQFHPLLPLLAKPFFWSPTFGLLIVSSIASLLFVLVFYRLASLDIPNPETATKLMLAFPVSFILFAPYTEGLWLLFAALSLWHARKDRWWAAGAAGAMADIDQAAGHLSCASACLRGLESWRTTVETVDGDRVDPSGVNGMDRLSRSFSFGRSSGCQQFQFAALYDYSCPSATMVVHEQAMLPPWDALWKAIRITQESSSRGNVVNLVLGGVFLGLAALSWRRLRVSYKILTAMLFAVAFGYYTGPQTPYMGLPRHLLLAFPIFIGAAPVLERFKNPIGAVFTFCMLLLALSYVLHAWVP